MTRNRESNSQLSPSFFFCYIICSSGGSVPTKGFEASSLGLSRALPRVSNGRNMDSTLPTAQIMAKNKIGKVRFGGVA